MAALDASLSGSRELGLAAVAHLSRYRGTSRVHTESDPALSVEQRLTADISQPEIRTVALRYLTLVATTLRPSTVTLRADSLIVFCQYLAAAHPEVRRLPQLTRAHLEAFLTYNHRRPWRGRVARNQPVAASVSKRAVVDLRAFFDDLAVWGWAERPAQRLLHPSDIPRLDQRLPRALTPDHDRDLMAAIARLPDPFARHGLTILRGTGIRLGELLDSNWTAFWTSPVTAAGSRSR